MKNPAYTIIVASRLFRDRLRHKTTIDGKSYLFISLSQQSSEIKLASGTYVCVERHISVYEDQHRNEKYGLACFHYTATYQLNSPSDSSNQKIIVHIYYSRFGKFLYWNAKDEDGNLVKLNNKSLKFIKNRAQQSLGKIINLIHKNISDKLGVIDSQLTEKQKLLEVQSQFLKPINSGKKYRRKLNKYLDLIDEVIGLIDERNLYSLHPDESCRNILLCIKHHYCAIRDDLKSDKPRPVAELPLLEEPKPTVSAKKVEDKKSKLLEQHKKLMSRLVKVKNKLHSLEHEPDIIKKAIRMHAMLKNKKEILDAITQPMDEEWLYLFTKYNELFRLAAKCLEFCAEKGIVQGLTEICKIASNLPAECITDAVANQHHTVLKILLKNFPMINVNYLIFSDSAKTVSHLNTPLLCKALENNDLNTFNCLLAHGANPNVVAANGMSPIHVAAELGLLEFVKVLFKYGARINNKVTMVYIASYNIKNPKQKPRASEPMATSNILGRTPLHIAAAAGHREVVRFLLEHKADAQCYEECDGFTAYGAATVRTEKAKADAITDPIDEELIKLFLEHGVPVDQLQGNPPYKAAPLHYATQYNDVQMVQFLLRKGADPTRKRIPDNLDVLSVAAGKGYVQIVDELLDNYYKKFSQENFNMAYNAAIQFKQRAILNLLREKLKPEVFATCQSAKPSQAVTLTVPLQTLLRALMTTSINVGDDEQGPSTVPQPSKD